MLPQTIDGEGYGVKGDVMIVPVRIVSNNNILWAFSMSIFFWNIVMYKLKQINMETNFIFISLFLILNDKAQGYFMFNENILSLLS